MNKLWRIAAYEYQRNVFKKSFLITLISMPLLMALSIGTGFMIETLGNNNDPVGYVDQAGVFSQAIPAPAVSGFETPVEFIPFKTEDEARLALEAGRIQAFYILPEHYRETRSLKLVSLTKAGKNATRHFFRFLQANLLSTESPKVTYRVAGGTSVTIRSIDGRREVPDSGPTFGILMPLLITGAFITLIFMSSGYLLSALADEKENRTIEILVTSSSTQQIITGKVAGILAISLTLVITWILIVALGIFIAAQAGIGWFQNLEMDWGTVLASAAITIPAFVLAAALMAALGAMVNANQEGQTLSTIISFLHLAPVYLGWNFLNHPGGFIAVLLSVLPFTSLVTVGLRNTFSYVPPWQIAASMCIQALSAAGAIWIAGRAFRLGMLRYGQRLSWRRLFASGKQE